MNDNEAPFRRAYRSSLQEFGPKIGEADRAECVEMLKTSVGQNTAVFALFGSTAQHAQHFEADLAAFLLDCNAKEISLQDLESLDQQLAKKTLGSLLKEFSKYVTISDPKVGEFLEFALKIRNFLMHQFFLQRAHKLGEERGRMELLTELSDLDAVLAEAATIIRALRFALAENRDEHSSSAGKAIFTIDIKMPSGKPT